MGTPSHLLRLAENNRWANHRLHKACAALTPEAFRARRTGFFPSIQATLDHILLIDLYYLAALTGSGRSIDVLEGWVPRTNAAGLAREQRRTDDRLCTFCADLREDDVDRLVVIDRGPGRLHRERIGETLTHLFLHDVHHRGQVHAMLSGTETAPPQLDEFFLDGDAPFRDPDLAEMGVR